jgi:hypothetical protein
MTRELQGHQEEVSEQSWAAVCSPFPFRRREVGPYARDQRYKKKIEVTGPEEEVNRPGKKEIENGNFFIINLS